MVDKKDLKNKLSKLLDMDDIAQFGVKDFDIGDDLILWGEKNKDYEGWFIHGEIITKNPQDEGYEHVLVGFAFDENDDLDELATKIINDIEESE